MGTPVCRGWRSTSSLLAEKSSQAFLMVMRTHILILVSLIGRLMYFFANVRHGGNER